MATTNLHLAKTIDGKALKLRDLKSGIKANFPSGVGGSITCVCTECTDTHATFESINKDWPATWTIRVDAKDLSLYEFIDLAEALDAYASWNKPCTDEQKALVRRASELGYAAIISATQACWTERGSETLKMLNSAHMSVLGEVELTDELLTKIISPEDAYELRDVIGDMTQAEKVKAIKTLLTAESIT